jgi:hypothetical protein
MRRDRTNAIFGNVFSNYNRVQRIKLMLIIASFDGRISMELRHLATFRTLATTLNFTHTAALLGYVQSSGPAWGRSATVRR